MIEEAFVAYLGDLAPIYPVYLPDRAGRPAIVYRRVSTTRDLTQSGRTGTMVRVRMQFSVHNDTHPEALALARTIIGRIDGHGADIDPAIELVTVDNELDLGFTPDADGWEYTLDAIVVYKEN